MQEEFPPEVREVVDGLLYLGHLESQVEFCGHTFGLRTLKGDEELLSSLLAKDYLESYGQLQAMAWSTVCLALTHVDLNSDFCPPIGPDKKAYSRARFNYCTSNWFWPTCAYLFKEYEALVQRRDEAVEALAGKSRQGTGSFSPLPGSSNDQDASPVPPEIQEILEHSE